MSHSSSTSSTYHKIESAEVSGVFSQEKYYAYTYRYNEPNSRVYHNGIIGDYHLFIRSGNKIYVEVKGCKEVVMSFDDLQKNRYLKYYYDLSLILAKNKHQIIKNEAFNKDYEEIYDYTGKKRLWSLETSYIDYIKQTYNKIYKIVPIGNVCYFKVNPYDIENMEYTSPQELELFLMIYMCRKDIMFGNFERRAVIYKDIAESMKNILNRSVIYKDIALEYQVIEMERELKELSTFFEDKKSIVDLLATLNSKYSMNDDILTMIYNIISIGDRYEYLAQKEGDSIILVE
jgi:hypothetical protein